MTFKEFKSIQRYVKATTGESLKLKDVIAFYEGYTEEQIREEIKVAKSEGY